MTDLITRSCCIASWCSDQAGPRQAHPWAEGARQTACTAMVRAREFCLPTAWLERPCLWAAGRSTERNLDASRRSSVELTRAESASDAVDGSSTGTQVPRIRELLGSHVLEELFMQTIKTIGLDIAKSVFQVHGIDAAGQVVTRRQLKRRFVLSFFEKLPPCLVGIEACASSHHWSRELQALDRFG